MILQLFIEIIQLDIVKKQLKKLEIFVENMVKNFISQIITLKVMTKPLKQKRTTV